NISLRHFSQTTGYGYDDIGRDTLSKVFADIFHTESAIVSPNIVSGTHALTIALFGILRPNQKLLCITGNPYDTLLEVINGDNIGSLKDFGVSFEKIDLLNGDFDFEKIKIALNQKNIGLVFIGRSRGYEWRDALSCEQIKKAIKLVKSVNPNLTVMVDNCYGEFIETIEPTDVGADFAVGSLIKNAGGGIAPTGGYICGTKKAVEQISYRLTSPSIGAEVGSYNAGYLPFYQGVFLAPHVTANAIKGSMLFGKVFDTLGYETMPKPHQQCYDIIRSIKFNTADELIDFVRSIQKASPVDSNVVPFAWDMPGYVDKVIMAAGTFVQGASIELSADSPIKEPYIAYLQGGLTYEHVKIACLYCLEGKI
ncbi:MAG: methionine gamma-lyase family protein, partial [Clostridia bacterium]